MVGKAIGKAEIKADKIIKKAEEKAEKIKQNPH